MPECCRFDAVIHFAGVKSVGQSVVNPLDCFDNNLIGTLNLFNVMDAYNCKKVCIIVCMELIQFSPDMET